MSFQEKNVAVTLGSFSLILLIYLVSIGRMLASGGLNESGVFRLWGVVIILAIFFTVAATIMTHIVSAIIEAIRTGSDDPQIEDIEDERDKLIDQRGTSVTYTVYSLGVFLAMLTFYFGQPPLVMFSLLILAGVVGQIVGDIVRLALYRRGF
jgi:hypothetical protein